MEFNFTSEDLNSSNGYEETENNFEFLNTRNKKSGFGGGQRSHDEEIENTFRLLETGEQKIKLSDSKESVLILGNTGAGKSSLTGWLLDDHSRLFSKEITKDSEEYTIEDDDEKIGKSTIMSKTKFPELFIESSTGEAYYDCPGFGDTRSTSHDISITYFNKKLADYLEKVKLVLVVSYPSVRKGVDRTDFMKLMKHCTELIKNVNKFKDSICMVVTKVDNTPVKSGGTYVPDDIIKKSIVGFLQQAKRDTYDQQISNLIDILCIGNEENYSRIALFRRPNEPGPLRYVKLLQEKKIMLQDMIRDEIEFAAKKNEDFGYTISEKSKNDINSLVEKINEKLAFYVKETTDQILKILNEKIQQDILMPNTDQNIVADGYLTSMKNLTAYLDEKDKNFRKFVREMEDLENLKQIIEEIEKLPELDHRIFEHLLININNQVNYLEFLRTVSDKELKLNGSNWIVHFQNLASHIRVLNYKVKCRIAELEKNITIFRSEEQLSKLNSEMTKIEQDMRLAREKADLAEQQNREIYQGYVSLQEKQLEFLQKTAQKIEESDRHREEEIRKLAEQNSAYQMEQMEAINEVKKEASLAKDRAHLAWEATKSSCTLQ